MSQDGRDRESPEDQGPQPIFLLPGVVAALCGALAAVHLASTFIFNEDALLQFTIWFGFIPFRLIGGEQLIGGIWPLFWTPVTHAFLHAGWDHLLLNVAWLAIFATPVARRYGTLPTLVIFGLSSAVGALAFAATTLPQLQVLIGASGGVAGLTGAATRFIFQPIVVAQDPITGERRVLGRHLAPLRQLFAETRTRYFVIIWVVLNAAVPLLPLLTGMAVQIAWQAHLGGFLTGLLLVGLFERRDDNG